MEKGFYQKIILPTRPQPDTILGIFLLRNFGKEKYPGLENAKIEIWQELPKGETPGSLEKKGILVLDLGGGKFDHISEFGTKSKMGKILKIGQKYNFQILEIRPEEHRMSLKLAV